MHYLFEKNDSLNTPVECFVFDASCRYFPVKSHWHYFEEIIYMLEGSAEMYSNEKRYILNEGDMILFHSKSVHSIYANGGGAIRYAVLKFDINRFTMTSDYAPRLRDIFKCAEKSNAAVFFESTDAVKMDCGRIFSSCINEMKTQNYGYDLVLDMHIYNLMMNIIRYWLDKGLVIDGKSFADKDEYDIDTVTEYIDEHIQDNIRVSELAVMCGMSYSGFAAKFGQLYGMGCKEYIERIRIFKAEEFLRFTDHDLNYISQETGFCDCSHMIKSFKKIKGITPKQFRINLKGKK
ncbi:MAG: helix-turn-helix transcriptional regulator [Oscillospiraceae bacterium]|nr:helix-turn-helix transcriptional regulator [Oscillospiraceae bacterium]